MNKSIFIINGPNLNLVGVREPEIYGNETISAVADRCRKICPDEIALKDFQSNHEGQILDWIHEARENAEAIIINAGAYTHTSIAILDALRAFKGIVIEVHISQVHKRENFRHHSYISQRADAVIVGFGMEGYVLATQYVVDKISK